MSYRDRIAECNVHDLSRFRPFHVGAARVGWIHDRMVPELRRYEETLVFASDRVEMASGLGDFAARTEAMAALCRDLRDRGLIAAWREERYPVAERFGGAPFFDIERAAAPLFGIRTYGVHVNGYVEVDGETRLWTPRRGHDRAVAPGKLDNIVAGGQPAGLGLMENLVKEAEEEASIPKSLAMQAVPVGSVSYWLEAPNGLKPDVLFCYDLRVPADFRPRNRDGEVGDFRLLPVREVMDLVRDTNDFKFNVNLVLIDFFIRHGLLTPDTEPDYVHLARALHA